MIDVYRIRAEAAHRGRSRSLPIFDGTIVDSARHGVPFRLYQPTETAHQPTVFFLHGGYGLFGDLDFQDGYCRTLARTFKCNVVSIQYRLAPEYTFKDSLDDALGVIADPLWAGPHLVCGDSAGGSLALGASRVLGPEIDGLLLTNPNVDLSLGSFDHDARGGPDFETSQFAFTSWTREMPEGCGRRLALQSWPRPPVFVACGSDDALLPETRALAAECRSTESKYELLELPAVGHGLMSNSVIASQVLEHAVTFFETHLAMES